jgi:hypothetical protein
MSRDVVLSGACGDIFIFQISLVPGPQICYLADRISGTFAQNARTGIVLVGGVRPRDVFWAVADTFTVGSGAIGASFQGIALANTAVTIMPGSVVNGRILSGTSVAIQDSNIMEDNRGCSGQVVTVIACKS